VLVARAGSTTMPEVSTLRAWNSFTTVPPFASSPMTPTMKVFPPSEATLQAALPAAPGL
jgi:hypothetical protein